MVVVEGGAPAVNPLRLVLPVQGKIRHDIVTLQQEDRIVDHVELLLDIDVLDPVDVGILVGVHLDLLDGEGRVIDPEVSLEGELVLPPRIEENVVAPFPIDEAAVRKDVVVDLGTQPRQGTGEFLVEEQQVVLVNVEVHVELLQEGDQGLVVRIARVLVGYELAAHLPGIDVLPVGLVHRLVDEDGQIDLARDVRGVNLVEYHFQAVEHLAVHELLVDVVQVELDLLVLVKLVAIVKVKPVPPLLSPDLFQDVHRGVVLLGHLPRIKGDLIELIVGLAQHDAHVHVHRLKRYQPGLKTHEGDFKLRIGGIRLEVEGTVLIRYRALGGSLEDDIGKGDRLILLIHDDAAHPDLCRSTKGQQ